MLARSFHLSAERWTKVQNSGHTSRSKQLWQHSSGSTWRCAAMDTRGTVDCSFFLRGLCNKGSFCPFKHDPVRAGGQVRLSRPAVRECKLASANCCSCEARVLALRLLTSSLPPAPFS